MDKAQQEKKELYSLLDLFRKNIEEGELVSYGFDKEVGDNRVDNGWEKYYPDV